MILGIHFPPLSHTVQWPAMWLEDSPLAINKVVLVYGFATLFTFLIFQLGSKRRLVPTGMQNFAEASLDFVDEQIVLPTMGPEGRKYGTLLTAIFFFVFFCNIFEVIPVMQMPATARIALPMFLALVVLVVFVVVGIVKQGPIGYLKGALFPPGVPGPIYILVTPIELVSTFLVRPFSLMVRLFANLLAGHILIVTFTVLSAGLWVSEWYVVFLPLPVFGVIFFVAFETMVSLLQAYVFALLAGVYISSSLSADH